MEQLIEMQCVTRLSPQIVRILGGNPGKFTLQGTNTYLISPQQPSSASTPCILVDTGEGLDVYTDALGKVLKGEDNRAGLFKRHISDIILTHRHHDHVGGLPSVLKLVSSLQSEPPRLHKYPDAESDKDLFKTLDGLPASTYKPHSSAPIRPLQEGDVISVGGRGGGGGGGGRGGGGGSDSASLRVVHSPGHTKDHICLFFQQDHTLLTGDHVLGQGTSVFEDLGSYLKSLQNCYKVLEEDSPGQERRLYPGHGPIIDEGKKALQSYLSHRLEREDQVLALLATKSPEEGLKDYNAWTIKTIVSKLYSDYPEHLYPAAARGIFLHLQKLALPDHEAIERGIVGQENEGRRVLCAGEGAGRNGLAPEMPKKESDWAPIMELEWRLLSRLDNTNGSL